MITSLLWIGAVVPLLLFFGGILLAFAILNDWAGLGEWYDTDWWTLGIFADLFLIIVSLVCIGELLVRM